MLRTPLLLASLALTAGLHATQDPVQEAAQQASQDAAPVEASAPQPLAVTRPGLAMPIEVPADERLVFTVLLDVAVLGETQVGNFVLSAGVEQYRKGLPRPNQPIEASLKRAGWIRGEATGGYLGYSIDHTIEARLLPTEWPAVIVRDYQEGTENRRRELMYGMRAGAPTSWYRRDHHCNGCDRHEHFIEGGFSLQRQRHCPGCKRGEHRVWVKPTLQEIPEGAVDMISAIHLARSLVRSEKDRIEVPLLDKESFWHLTMARGEVRDVKTPAGTFRCQAIKIDPKAPEGTDRERRFKGLFGIHGTLSIWLDELTGVPVRIEGDVPLGPLNLDVALVLAGYRGAPTEFQPLDVRAK